MLSMKEKIEAKKSILCSLTDVPESTANDIFTGLFDGKEMKDIDDLLDEMKEDRYIDKYVPNGKREYAYVLTRKGNEFAEHISCSERFEAALNICSKLNDYSERTVFNVYDQLLQKDISELVGNPFSNLADAVYQLNGTLDIMRFSR